MLAIVFSFLSCFLFFFGKLSLFICNVHIIFIQTVHILFIHTVQTNVYNLWADLMAISSLLLLQP